MLLAALLALLAVVVFLPALDCGFVEWDDPQTVPAYAIVLRGLSAEGVAWAFTHDYFAHWLPLTVMSHMLDWQLFGDDARGHHLSSLLLHSGTVVLVFLFWVRAGGRWWRAAAVAALFAIHPLRVEPVVWVAARKDMLSGFFALLALLGYLAWARRPSRGRYALVTAWLLLGLLAKPMVVSLPLCMLLLDFWPLRRLSFAPASAAAGARVRAYAAAAWPLVREKLPWLALAAAGAVGALVSQRLGGAMAELDALPAGVRLGNAFISYAKYLGKTFWPVELSAFYAFPVPPAGLTRVLPAVVLFAALTAGALAAARRWPWLTFGWLWFVVTLLPVIGIVQVGDQAMADRYTYLPAVGLLAALVWSAAELARTPLARQALAVVAAAALVACAVTTRWQVRWWRDTPTLFGRMLALDPDNHVAHINLGTWLSTNGRPSAAIPHFRRAIARRPAIALAHTNLGSALRRTGDHAGAERALRRGIELAPDSPGAHLNLAALYDDQGKVGLAVGHLARAVALEPNSTAAWQGLASVLSRPAAARLSLPYVEAVAREEPSSPELRRVLALVRRLAAGGAAPRPSAPGPAPR